MKKRLLLTTSLICIGLSAQAQLRFGVMGGFQSSQLHASASGVRLSTSGLLGIHIGGVVEYAVNEKLYIQPGLMLSFKGGNYRDGFDAYKTSLTYLEVPVQAIYKHEIGSGKLVGGIGPYFGFLMGGTDDDEPIAVGKEVKGFDAGLKLSGGYELTEKKLLLNLFYNAGLANINPSSLIKLKNSTVGLSITYFFGGQ
ncbi:porin family protein [Spirosoma endophyticum]|uniref:Outer membrane protein beta-barrel domain-containing protein n=1 Tax=Spirosoma endophyticum TaxID=662367 RepID=A0A1I2GG91_9BACT|nr:porin family protein [Spirosoma endophyticum]SFF16203.1 Outer membrane protein beta-barrel domain-containing protein [Spirosoma endophyticum]